MSRNTCNALVAATHRTTGDRLEGVLIISALPFEVFVAKVNTRMLPGPGGRAK